MPVMLVVLIGLVWGNTPDPTLGGYGGLDAMVPAYFALIIVIAGLINLPISLAVRREQGILRRFRATPLRPAIVLSSQVLVNLLLATTGAVLLIVVGRALFNLLCQILVALACLVRWAFAVSFCGGWPPPAMPRDRSPDTVLPNDDSQVRLFARVIAGCAGCFRVAAHDAGGDAAARAVVRQRLEHSRRRRDDWHVDRRRADRDPHLSMGIDWSLARSVIHLP
jgi:hypothetical protein